MALSYDFTTIYILGQKFVKFLVGFLENLRYQKDILRPLRFPAMNLRSKNNNKEDRKKENPSHILPKLLI